ncbi:hypothetical protein AB0N46_32715 [Streptomyces albidoflavus]|uniref:hypothetical protein n=1 Tax=Streptomyces albidoflavus TaxID=1886 RepID=UPI003443BDD2
MLVDLSFHHPDDPGQNFDADRELDAVPRVGEEVLWTDEAEHEGRPQARYRVYRVVDVCWSMGADTTGASVLVKMEFRSQD